MCIFFSCCYSVPTLQQNKDSQKWQYHIELIFKMKKWWHCLNHVQYLISAFIGNSILKQLYYIHYLSTIQDFLIIMYRLICEMSYSLFDKDWHNIPIYIKQTSFISYAIARNCVIRPKLCCYSSCAPDVPDGHHLLTARGQYTAKLRLENILDTLFTRCTLFIPILGLLRVVLCSGGLLTAPHNGGGRQSSARPRPQLISHMTAIYQSVKV